MIEPAPEGNMRKRQRMRFQHRKGRARGDEASNAGAANGEGDETAAELDYAPAPALSRKSQRRITGGDQITIRGLLKKQQTDADVPLAGIVSGWARALAVSKK